MADATTGTRVCRRVARGVGSAAVVGCTALAVAVLGEWPDAGRGEPPAPTTIAAPPDGSADARRDNRLGPAMTSAEAESLWRGRRLLGQACGAAADAAGRACGAFWNVYPFEAAGGGPGTLVVGYLEGGDGRPFEFSGPGFRYVLRGGEYVAVVAPPE